MSGSTVVPKKANSTAVTGTSFQGSVVSFSNNSLTIKLANGHQKTFTVTPKDVEQLKLHKGQKVTVIANGNTALKVSSR